MSRAASLPPPRKRFGQHFLIDPNIVRKIVGLAAIQSGETVLEIGPGRGALTPALCAAARSVIAVELDPALHAHLAGTLAGCPNLTLHLGDALKFPYADLPPGTVVVANLPYNVGTTLLMRLLEARHRLTRMIVMLQTEVAQRLAAAPGTDQYGALSVLTQAVADVRIAFHVAPTCFRPRPKVGSSIVTLTFPPRQPVAIAHDALFARTVKAAFAHRRKTLVNSLRDEGFAPARVGEALEGLGLDGSRRAETLSIQEFARLAGKLGEVL